MLVGSRMIEHPAFQPGGHEFLIYEVPRIIVGILVTVGIAQIGHQFGRSIPEVQGNCTGPVFLNHTKGLLKGHV